MTDQDRPLAAAPAAPAVPVPAAGGDSAVTEAASAGAMLRAARQQQGLHIAALAAAMKVPPARLEALEAGRYHELVDTTFARALAQSMCRVLRIDPVPVLALLPGSSPDALGRVDGGLNTPFREHGGRGLPADWAPWRHPVLWLVALLLLAAAAFVLVPAGALRDPPMPAAGAPLMPPDAPASAPVGALRAPALDTATGLPSNGPGVGAAATAEQIGAAAVSAANALPVASGGSNLAPAALSASALGLGLGLGTGDAATTVHVRALKDTWVQAVDANKQTLLARMLPAGETVTLSPAMPLRVRIGNVAGTELLLRGQPVDLSGGKRDNIVSLTLQ